jgi:hypothetical protein
MKALYLILILFTAQAARAVTIKGRISDKSGEGLDFATILQKGTTNGTVANNDGHYTIEVPEGKHIIICQFVGYKSQSKEVNATGSSVQLDFILEPQSLEISEVVIRASKEDPAYDIMRKVIAKRKYYADLVKTFETDVYLKGNLKLKELPKSIRQLTVSVDDQEVSDVGRELGLDSTGKGIIYLLEQYSKYTYKAPSKRHTNVISVRQSGDPKGLGLAQLPAVINIYENNIPLTGLNPRGFISPANTNAFMYYRYKFLGSYMDGDRMVSKIQVTPKRKYEPLFSGYVYVVDNEWVFQAVDLLLTQESQINIDTFRIEQFYVPVQKDVWIIQSQVLYPVLGLLGIKFSGNFVTSYKNQRVNQPIDESIFEGRIISTYDSLAHSREKNYWDTMRPIPLENDEIKNYTLKDSLFEARNNDSASSVKTSSVSIAPSGFSYSRNRNTFRTNSILSMVSYNTVEGVNAMLNLGWEHWFNSNTTLKTEALNRYGFANKQYNLMGKIELQRNDPRWANRYWKLGVQGGQYVFQLNNNTPISNTMNLLYTLLAGDNYMKLYQSRHIKLVAEREFGNGLSADISFNYEQRMPLFNTAFYTFSKSDEANITPNQPFELPAFETHNAAVLRAHVRYQPGWKYIQHPGQLTPVPSNAPVFSAQFTKGIKGIGNSKTDFDKWSLSIEHKVRLRMLGTLDYRVGGGGFFNDSYAGIPDMKHLMGNKTLLANPYLYSFQLAPYYRYSNTASLYGQLHAEWHLNGWLTNKIPGFRQLDWHLVGGTNTMYIDKNNYYSEVFVGLENIGFGLVRVGRLDFIAGYESGKSSPSIGLRLGFNTGIIQGLSSNQRKVLD